ncbi:hypothetical protein [Streptomyces griseosporeus]|uniref:hypothetical protein n=1 Tax=Streptomyces griseosporeus TaxID=1910 RepID=UPI0036FC4411
MRGEARSRIERMAANARHAASQRAYNAYADHWEACETCNGLGPRCADAEALWQAYKATTAFP